MKRTPFYLWFLLLSFWSISACISTKPSTNIDETTTSEATSSTEEAGEKEYVYETVPNDPLNAKLYTLENGLKVYMSVYKDAPRIQTFIAVAAGSMHDPADNTGLAHYLEHMMFKGTNNIGSIDWEKEKVLLQEISDLYEEYRKVTDPAKRKEIYAKIDATSNEAAKYVIANEYDKMVASLGAKGTNAFTSVEETVYVNDIPSNELGKWLKLESERFKMMVLRLFHTELEAVYEEFNIGQDSDGRKVNKTLFAKLFPSHTYGTQTTIGEGEHLKNPSHIAIHDYFNKYYVPNNMAIVLAGDFDPDEAVAMIEEHFGDMKPKELKKPTFPPQPEVKGPEVVEVFGQEKEFVDHAWKLPGEGTKEALMGDLVKKLLTNGQAGLIDLNVLQQQKALEATAYGWAWADYSIFGIEGTPREGQTMEQLSPILLEQLEKIKKGEFDDWLLDAVKKDTKLGKMRQYGSIRGRASDLKDAFVRGQDYAHYATKLERMDKITKAEIVAFANKYFRDDNYVLIYKRNGDDPNVYKVEKPAITPVPVNRKDESKFLQEFNATKSDNISPVFLDYSKDIKEMKLNNGVQLDYIKNPYNPTFNLYYVLEMGSDNDKYLPLAVEYLPYLGTAKQSAKELQQEFFKLGVSFDVFSGSERVYVALSGLEESLEQGVALFENVLANVVADKAALDNVIADILKSREDDKKNKGTILRRAMASYAKYGPNSSFSDVLSEAELKSIKAEKMVELIKGLTSYEHKIFYYGQNKPEQVKATLDKLHQVPAKLKPLPAAKEYTEVDIDKDQVYFVNFPMVQAEVMLVSKGNPYNLEEDIMSELYNNYFGFGLSSIVFQEIRESQALAYSAWAFFSSPNRKDRSHYMQAYVGTQVDKMPSAIPAMKEILDNMPVSEAQIETARMSILKKIESDRITKTRIYFDALANRKLGFDYDVRKDVYNKMKTTTAADLKKFQEEKVKGRNYVYLVLGEKDKVDMNYLKTLGEVKELTMEEVFGY